MAQKLFYAVGWKDPTKTLYGWPRVVRTWHECCTLTKGVSGGCKYKKFTSIDDAAVFLCTTADRLLETIDEPVLSPLETEATLAPTLTPPTVLDIYTDGGCDDNGTWFAAAGFGVAVFENSASEPCFTVGAHLPFNPSVPPTNIQAELHAVCVALEHVLTCGKAVTQLRLHVDLQLALDYLNGTKVPTTNADIVRRAVGLLGLVRAVVQDVRLCKVKAHSGVPGNELADTLATAGKKQYGGIVHAKKRARVMSSSIV